MSTLLVWREKLQRIYALYSIYIQKVHILRPCLF